MAVGLAALLVVARLSPALVALAAGDAREHRSGPCEEQANLADDLVDSPRMQMSLLLFQAFFPL